MLRHHRHAARTGVSIPLLRLSVRVARFAGGRYPASTSPPSEHAASFCAMSPAPVAVAVRLTVSASGPWAEPLPHPRADERQARTCKRDEPVLDLVARAATTDSGETYHDADGRGRDEVVYVAANTHLLRLCEPAVCPPEHTVHWTSRRLVAWQVGLHGRDGNRAKRDRSGPVAWRSTELVKHEVDEGLRSDLPKIDVADGGTQAG